MLKIFKCDEKVNIDILFKIDKRWYSKNCRYRIYEVYILYLGNNYWNFFLYGI